MKIKIGWLVLLLVPIMLLAQEEQNEAVRTFSGHTESVFSVIFSPDGRCLATGSWDNTAKLWEVQSGQLLRTFSGHNKSVLSVAFSPDGRYLATGSEDFTAKLWEVQSGQLLRTFSGHTSLVSSVAFSPDGRYLATGSSDKTAKLWEVASGKLIQTFSGHNLYVNSVAFSPDGRYLATGSGDTTAKLWAVESGQLLRTFSGHTDRVNSVAFSPDGRYLATGSWDKTAKLWAVQSGKLSQTFSGHNDDVNSVAFSPDGRYLTTGSGDNTAKLWEVSSGKLIQTFRGHNSPVWAVAFSPDGRYLATGSADNTAKLWEIPNPVSLLLAEKSAKIQVLKTEQENKLAELFAPQGEFETTAQYQQRLKTAEQQKPAIIAFYQQKIQQVEQEYQSKIQAAIAQSRRKITLKNGGSIERYNPDKQVFPFTYKGQKYELSVPLSSAPDFKNRFSTFSIEYETQLNEQGTWDQFNWAVVDPQTGARYPFGEQRGKDPVPPPPKPDLPPQLKASLTFSEPSGEGYLDAGEKGLLTVEIVNSGKGNAVNLMVEVQAAQKPADLWVENLKTIPVIKPGEKKTLTFAFEAGDNLTAGLSTFTIKFSEANGFEPEPTRLSFNTRALMPPDVVVADIAVRDQSDNGKIEPMEIATVTVLLQNRGNGATKSSKVVVQPGANVFLTGESASEFVLGNIPPGGIKDIEFTFYTNNRVQDQIPLSLRLDDARPKFQKTLPLNLQVNVPQKAPQELVFKGTEQKTSTAEAPLISVDIEKDIPQLKLSNPDAIAVVIGNRDYSRVKNVEFAIRDAEFVKDYLIKMLGYKEGNILLIKNATNADFLTHFGTKDNPRGKLADLVKSGKSDVFIYYSGHGAPGLKTHKGYFAPVDCDPQRIELTGYPLEVFYNNLAQIPAKSYTVVIDACFSGADILSNISPIVIEVETPTAVLKNAVVFSSTSSTQVSTWYNEKFHSLFTYFFLKGLHNFNADLNHDKQITYSELYQYLSDQNEGVPYWARRLHSVDQTPVLQGDQQERVFIRY